MRRFFTSESVTEGHPDKVCDRIADKILDELLKQDEYTRSAVECCAAYDTLFITGEVTSKAVVDYEKTAREAIREIGYNFGGFAYDKCEIISRVHGQSPDIALGVDSSLENKAGGEADDLIGAGDQGMMFGYACHETEELMPLPVMLAHKLAQRLAKVRKDGTLAYLRPDGKTQVTVEYEGNVPVRVSTIVVSTQHDEKVTQECIASDIKKHVVQEVVPSDLLDEHTAYLINPTGRFEIGGPEGDSGLTGRKIVVDTYGGRCAHGGGTCRRCRITGRLCDRRGEPRFGVRRYLRHGQTPRRRNCRNHQKGIRFASCGDHPHARASPSRIRAYVGLRAFRQRGVSLGKDRSR